MDRTLYLSENRGLMVFRDGHSIWIKEDGKAGRRIPVRLVGRVVIIGNVRLESGAITLFTDNHIPVTMINRRGDSAAVVVPYNHQLAGHSEEQKVLLETEENIERFKNWLYARRRELQFNVIKRLSKSAAGVFAEKGFREKDYQRIISEFKPFKDDRQAVAFRIISNLFREIVIGCIMKADIDPHLGVFHRRHNFSLALDLCHILEAEADMQSIRFLRTSTNKGYLQRGNNGWAISKDGMRDIIHRFENRRKQVQETVERLIDDVFALMRELRR